MSKAYAEPKKIEFYPLKHQILLRKDVGGKVLRLPEDTLEPEEVSEDQIAFDSNSYNIAFKVDAIYGIMKLVNDSYFIVVEKSERVAEILGKKIYRALEFRFIPIKRTMAGGKDKPHAGGSQDRKDQKFVDMFLRLLNKGIFYFSDEYNLTSALQTLVDVRFDINCCDSKFFINRFHLKKFIESNVNYFEFISPFIIGFVTQDRVEIEKTDQTLLFTLISRKDTSRLGARFYSRGADIAGNVSNFVESEQILDFVENRPRSVDKGAGDYANYFDNKIISFMQVRGSIPLIWSQPPTLKYVPSMHIGEDVGKSEKAYKLHFQKLMLKYDRIQVVNLIDKVKSQYVLGKAFANMHEKVSEASNEQYKDKVDFVWFDYHHECRGMKMENLHKLMDVIKDNLTAFQCFECNYFDARGTGERHAKPRYEFKVLKHQKGVIRTNCIDNLDRTNVVQSVIARWMFLTILKDKNIIPGFNNLFTSLPGRLEQSFRDAWTDNADALSIQYSGTPALKTDFTRTGKRGIKGACWDGYNSAKRYFLNHFLDYEVQNTYDFLVANISVKNYQFYEPNKGIIIRCRILKTAFLAHYNASPSQSILLRIP